MFAIVKHSSYLCCVIKHRGYPPNETLKDMTTKEFQAVKRIASENPEGFTIDTETLKHVKADAWVVAYRETQDSFGDEGLRRAFDFAREHSKVFGGWQSGDHYYYDADMLIEDREEAINVAKANAQLAIYNIKTAEYIEIE